MRIKAVYIGVILFLMPLFVSHAQLGDTSLHGNYPDNPGHQNRKDRPLSVLVLLGEWFGDAYFPLKKEIEARGWTLKKVGVDVEYRGCYNKARDVVLRSDILIPDINNLSRFDCLIIPSGPQWRKFNQNPQVLEFIRDVYDSGMLIASFCVGNFTVKAAGLIDSLSEQNVFPKQVTLFKERILLGPQGGGPPPGNGHKSAPVKEICDAIARYLEDKENRRSNAASNWTYFGQKPPGMTPRIFAPGIVSTESHEFSCSFTPDGKEFYFTRRDPNLNRNVIMVTKCVDGVWTKPDIASFNGEYMAFEPRITPKGDRLYFTSSRPIEEGGPPMNTWYVDRQNGKWGEPKNPGEPFNPMKTMTISVTSDNTVYTTDISRGMGKESIAVIKPVKGEYMKMERLGAPISTGKKDMYPCIAPDERFLLFCSDREAGENSSGLFVSFRNKDGTWSEPKSIALRMEAGLPLLSPDGKYLFFTAGERGKSDIYWVDAKIIEKAKPDGMK